MLDRPKHVIVFFTKKIIQISITKIRHYRGFDRLYLPITKIRHFAFSIKTDRNLFFYPKNDDNTLDYLMN